MVVLSLLILKDFNQRSLIQALNLFFSDNAADAEITGVEGDFTYYADKEGLTVSGAFSVLDSEITKKLVPTKLIVYDLI